MAACGFKRRLAKRGQVVRRAKWRKNKTKSKLKKIAKSSQKGQRAAQPLARELIWLAAKPAPKPLSMFTTVTPLPQLLSMPSSAATPPKLAP